MIAERTSWPSLALAGVVLFQSSTLAAAPETPKPSASQSNSASSESARDASAQVDGDESVLVDERRVVEMALADHPNIQAALDAKRAAEAGYDAAQFGRLPNLRVTGRYTRLSSIPTQYRSLSGFVFPQLLDQLGVRAELSVPLTDTFLGLAAAARAAGHEADARAVEVMTARAQVAYEARLAFLEYWSLTLALQNAEELVRAAETNARDQRNRRAAGTVAPNDVLEFEVALDAARMTRQAAEADVVTAEAALRVFLPKLASKKLRVSSVLDASEGPALTAPAAPRELPQLALLEAQSRAAKARATSESLSRLPRLSAYVAGDVSAPSPRVFVLTRLVGIPTWEAGLQLEWSLTNVTSGSARTAQARAEHRVLLSKLEAARRKLEGERTGAVGVLTLAQERVKSAKERVEHAAALAKARRGELDAGSTLPLNVVLAETDLARAKNELVGAIVAQALAMAKVDFVDGRTEPSAGSAR